MNEDDIIRKTPKKLLEAMGAIAVGHKGQVEVMEVIGRKGLAVNEYVDGPDKPLPYHILRERHTL
jgi:hypothetical protein